MNRKVIQWKTLTFILVIWVFAGGVVYGAPGPIKIGFVGDFSSVSQEYTRNAYQAAQMFMEDLNAEGGLLGSQVQLIRRDGGNDPQRHYRHVIDLVRDEKIVAVFGGASSPCVLKASSACREQKIPYLVCIGNSQTIVVENGHPFVFMFEPNSRMESLGFSIFATLMPWERYAWIGPDYVWGRDILEYFKQYFRDIGSPIEWTAEVWHPLGTTDYEQEISDIISSKPDALVVATWGEDLRHFIRQAKTAGLFDKVSAFGWFSIISTEVERTLPEGIWKISRGPFNYLAAKYPQTKIFAEKYSSKFNTTPLGFTISCYDSLIAWKQAVQKAQSAEPVIVAQTLKGMSFVGLRGESNIRSIDGQLDCPVFFGRIAYPPQYPLAVIESVIEIPASKVWLSEKEVEAARAKN